ncbi:C-Myc-binding protein isoform X1 [Corvus hawaiiensis]|uniref:C-Myc-binding protein isoform X1 n=1 Tax=Corvus hawaiiensis TaxID=134902 RepID=UPI002019E4D9|nr:C-Myc-binding protein isoform X1 [Corvus hawaiiensis]
MIPAASARLLTGELRGRVWRRPPASGRHSPCRQRPRTLSGSSSASTWRSRECWTCSPRSARRPAEELAWKTWCGVAWKWSPSWAARWCTLGEGRGPLETCPVSCKPFIPRTFIVWGSIVRVLVALYEEPEKPDSALDFLKHHLGASAPENPEIEALRLEVAEMKEKYEAVMEENKKLKIKLAQYEPPQDEKHGE